MTEKFEAIEIEEGDEFGEKRKKKKVKDGFTIYSETINNETGLYHYPEM